MKRVLCFLQFALICIIIFNCISLAKISDYRRNDKFKPEQEVITAEKQERAAYYFSEAKLKALYSDNGYISAAMIEAVGLENALISVNGKKCSFGIEDDGEYSYIYIKNKIEAQKDNNIIVELNGEVCLEERANAYEIVRADNGWAASDDGHTLYTYSGSGKFVTVPNMYRDKLIRSFGGKSEEKSDGAVFYNILNNSESASISGVKISDGINMIGDYAFYGIASLNECNIPNSIEYIGGLSFASTGIKGKLIIPERTKEIYAYAFMDTGIAEVELNEGLKRLCSAVFANCTELKKMPKLPLSLSYMGNQVFLGCTGMSGDVYIPANIKKVGDAVFYNCASLDGKVILEEGIEEIGKLSFGSEYEYKNSITEFLLPNSLVKIGPYAMQCCVKVKKLSLPKGLKIISDGAFDHMEGLEQEELVIPTSVEIIGGDLDTEENTGYGGHIFYDMGNDESFSSIRVENGNKCFKSIGGVLYSIDGKRMLAYPRGKRESEFEIPEGVTQIDEMAFSRAKYLKKLVLPDSYHISNVLPENILNQDANTLSAALYVYTGVEEIAVKQSNKYYECIDGLLYSKGLESLWYIPNKYNGEVNIAEGTKRIEKGAVFTANRENTGWNEINIPKSVEYIDNCSREYINKYFKTIVNNSSLSYFTENDGYLRILGDTDNDDDIDNVDFENVINYIIGKKAEVFNEAAADCNRDGKIDIRDAVLILRKR